MAKPSPLHAGNPSLVAIGEAIRAARGDAGISQEALANAADIDRSYMGGIERGEHNLTIINLIRVATALRLKPSDLFKKSGL